MYYVNTNSEDIIGYHASDMILKIVSHAALLVLHQAQIRASAIYYLGCKYKDKTNGAIDVLFQNIKKVFSSASEDEILRVYLDKNMAAPSASHATNLDIHNPKTAPFLKLTTAPPTEF